MGLADIAAQWALEQCLQLLCLAEWSLTSQCVAESKWAASGLRAVVIGLGICFEMWAGLFEG